MDEIEFSQTVTAEQEHRFMQVQKRFERGELDDEYAKYILAHSSGDRLIFNGDSLIAAMEDSYLSMEFMEEMAK